MNKLIVVEEVKEIPQGEYEVSFEKTHLKITKNTILHSDDVLDNSLDILIEDKASLKFYQIIKMNKDLNISFKVGDKATLDYHLLVLNKGKHKLEINMEMPCNEANANIIVRAINEEEDSNLDIICNGAINEGTHDNVLVEDLKGLITYNFDTIKISPIMLAHTNLVTANHLVTIGSYNKDELFYLNMRGLNTDKAKELLKKAFIRQGLSLYLQEKLENGGDI